MHAPRLRPLVPLLCLLIWCVPGRAAAGPLDIREVLQLLRAWTAAQQAGDVAAYLALYDAGRFQGLKRTARGGETRYDFAGWRADREPQVRKRPSVATRFETLGPPREGVQRVSFVQSFKLGKYEDHGRKHLDLARGPGGAPRIVYEELEASRPGFSGKGVHASEVTGLAPPFRASLLVLQQSVAEDGMTTSAVVLKVAGAGDAPPYVLGLGLYQEMGEVKVTPEGLEVAGWWAGAGDVLRVGPRKGKGLLITREEQDEGMKGTPRPADLATVTLPPGAVRFVRE
jgi:hypothetical protein